MASVKAAWGEGLRDIGRAQSRLVAAGTGHPSTIEVHKKEKQETPINISIKSLSTN